MRGGSRALHNGAKRRCFIWRSGSGAMLHLSRRSGAKNEARLTAHEACCGNAAKYEALWGLHAEGVSTAPKHEAALRAMKRSLDRLHFFVGFDKERSDAVPRRTARQPPSKITRSPLCGGRDRQKKGIRRDNSLSEPDPAFAVILMGCPFGQKNGGESGIIGQRGKETGEK